MFNRIGSQKLLFADFSTPEEHANKEVARYKNTKVNPRKRAGIWLDTLIEQTINATIVGGCAAFSALAASVGPSWKVGLYAFALAFFFELRKYRKI